MQSARSNAPEVHSSTKPACESVLKLTAPKYAEAKAETGITKSGDELEDRQVAPSEEPSNSNRPAFQGHNSSRTSNTKRSFCE